MEGDEENEISDPPGARFGRGRREAEFRRDDLTPREREVVRMLADGLTGPEIAHALVLSHNTVRTHVRNAMLKTGARTRAQLVAIVLAGERPRRS